MGHLRHLCGHVLLHVLLHVRVHGQECGVRVLHVEQKGGVDRLPQRRGGAVLGARSEQQQRLRPGNVPPLELGWVPQVQDNEVPVGSLDPLGGHGPDTGTQQTFSDDRPAFVTRRSVSPGLHVTGQCRGLIGALRQPIRYRTCGDSLPLLSGLLPQLAPLATVKLVKQRVEGRGGDSTGGLGRLIHRFVVLPRGRVHGLRHSRRCLHEGSGRPRTLR
mmetsp:Transcript_108554/g.187672  ORF Transcript_108554/g.187672 Transcript_108554/m.187672 type:complete len:217 (-) Transcript_108554:665-1315(-)